MLYQGQFDDRSMLYAAASSEAGVERAFAPTSVFAGDGQASTKASAADLRAEARAWQGVADRARMAERVGDVLGLVGAAKRDVVIGVTGQTLSVGADAVADFAEGKVSEKNAQAAKAEAAAKQSGAGRSPNSQRSGSGGRGGDFERGGFRGDTYGGRASALGAGEGRGGWA
jgi:hypothetical protein